MSTLRVDPWPRYSKALLNLDSTIVKEVDSRLSTVCSLYSIDQLDPDWERQLLVTLLNRHVPSFRTPRRKRKPVDVAFLIEVIDGIKDTHEQKDGRRPSTEAVVQEIVDTPKEANPFHGMSRSRITRIYSGRGAELEKLRKDLTEDSGMLTRLYECQIALARAPKSHAALLFAAMTERLKPR